MLRLHIRRELWWDTEHLFAHTFLFSITDCTTLLSYAPSHINRKLLPVLVISTDNSCQHFCDVVCLPSDSRFWSFAVGQFTEISFTDSGYHFLTYLYSQNMHWSGSLSRDDKNTQTIPFAEIPDFTSVCHPVAGKRLPFWPLVCLSCSSPTVQVWLLQ